MDAGLVVVLVLAGTGAGIVLSAVIGARRGTSQVGTADDPAVERSRAEAVAEHQRHDHGGAFH